MFEIKKEKQCGLEYSHDPHEWAWREYPFDPVKRHCSGLKEGVN